jgi:adenylate cyclase
VKPDSRDLGTLPLDEQWRMFLLGTHPGIQRNRRRFGPLPSSPRCNTCKAPFHGIGGFVLRNFGYEPWEKNPRTCKACITRMARYGAAGAEIELSMLFADVRDSTALGESMTSAEFSALMNRFYTTASTALMDNDALLDKFVGDAVIGLFVPLLTGEAHASRAVEAARALLRATGHGSAAGPWIQIGIGVHTGVARVGLVGTVGGVLDFTALGDNVNTTARLASSAGAGEILVSDAAVASAHLDRGALEHRDLTLKGKAEPVGATVLRESPSPVGQ